jgi:hypothetical protein
MKRIRLGMAFSFLISFLLFSMPLLSWSQNDNSGNSGNTGSTSVTTETTSSSTTTTTEWYTQPWVWVVGGAVLLIILVALLRGGSSRDTEVSRTTVIKDDRR